MPLAQNPEWRTPGLLCFGVWFLESWGFAFGYFRVDFGFLILGSGSWIWVFWFWVVGDLGFRVVDFGCWGVDFRVLECFGFDSLSFGSYVRM